MTFSTNPAPISGVLDAEGREINLWCADDGGYWWHRPDVRKAYGPYGLGLDNDPALDAAFAALATI